jgi:integrase
MGIRQREWRTPSGKMRSAWVVDYFDAKGKRRLKTFKTKRAADDWRSGTKVELRQGVHVADGASVTVEAAGRLWLASCEAAGLELSTREAYRRHLELHMVPLIGSTTLNKLSVPTVRAFQDQLREVGRSPAMVRKVITSLGSILADAQERGLATRNPVRERKRRSGPADRHRARLAVGVDIPAPADVRAVLGAAQGRWRAFVALAALAGLRISELRGLAWRDVDFAAATVTVRQRADAWNNLGSPKAAASRRTIPVPPLVINALKEWKLACPRRDTGKVDAAGKPVTELHLVFPTDTGRVMGHGDGPARHAWHALQAGAGVTRPAVDESGAQVLDKDGNVVQVPRYPGFHALRHFYASWCAARPQDGGLGLPLKTVQVRMGHSTLAMTADTYGHLFPSTDDADVLAAGERSLMGT